MAPLLLKVICCGLSGAFHTHIWGCHSFGCLTDEGGETDKPVKETMAIATLIYLLGQQPGAV